MRGRYQELAGETRSRTNRGSHHPLVEARRLHYNVLTLVWALLWASVSYLKGNHLWTATVLMIPTYLLAVQLPANIWYTGGWIFDLILKKVFKLRWTGFGPWAFGVGIGFSFLFILVVVFL